MMRKILFLDRDGIVNVDTHFVSKIDEIIFVEGIFELCKYFQEQQFEIVIITNQSGISRKLFTELDFHSIMKFIIKEFRERNIPVLAYFYCPHNSDDQCTCRKPLPGLFTKAIQEFDVLADNCISIGDRERDISAALAAGVTKNYLLHDQQISQGQFPACIVVNSLKEIVKIHRGLLLKAQNQS